MVEVGDDSRRNEGTGKCFTMDEAFLNDLLECSVCLEQLDSTSKVLPCQHTFCKRCLQEIVNSHKELRCPECRVLVDAKIEELPCNILLVRLLEGIKNNVRPKRVSCVVENALRGSGESDSPTHQTPPHPQLPQVSSSSLLSSDLTTVPKQVLQPCPCAKALYPYEAKVPGDLTFKKGDIIILRKRVDQNWFYGELGEKSGFVPASFVQVVLPIGTHVPQCKALYDFQISNSEGKDCLTFGKGDILTVIRRIDDHWAEGKLRERIGIFPISFVEMNAAARAVMKLSVNMAPGSSSILPPPAPSNDTRFIPIMPSSATSTGSDSNSQESSPAISSPPLSASLAVSSPFSSSAVFTSPAHSVISSSSHHSQMPESFAPVEDQSFGAVLQQKQPMPLFQSLAVAGAHPDTGDEPQQQQQQQQQRECKPETSISFRSRSTPSPGPVFTSVAVATPPIVSQRAESMSCPRTSPQNIDSGPSYMSSGDSSKVCQTPSRAGGTGHPPTHVPVPNFYLALYSYRPQKDDELELRKGELYTVSEKCLDGWFKGTSLRTGHCGVFPGNYVQLAKSAVLQTHMMTSSANQMMMMSSSTTSPSTSVPVMSQQRPPSVTESGHPLHPSSINFSNSGPSSHGGGSGVNVSCNSSGGVISAGRAPASSPSPVSLSHPAVSDWAHSVSAIGAAGQRHSRPPSGIAPGLYKPEMVSKNLSCNQPRSPNLSPWTTDFGPVPTASPLVTDFPANTTSSSPTRMLSYQSSSNGGNNPMVGSGSHPESLTRYCVSQPSTPLMMPTAHMSSSTNPFVATGGPSNAGSCSSASSPGMNPMSQARMEKHKEKKEKEIVSLMKRLTKRKSKSPPPSDFSCDNPTFVDSSSGGGQSLATVHIRSTSCPSEALGSQGVSHKKTSSFDSCGNNELPRSSSRPKQPAPLVRERFRCIVPYPPNSDYELELKVGDVVYVHKKRDDGWYKGTLQRTGKTGLFPSSFVEGF